MHVAVNSSIEADIWIASASFCNSSNVENTPIERGKLISFFKQQHTFLHEVMVVIVSIENATKDSNKRAANLKLQIRIDENSSEKHNDCCR